MSAETAAQLRDAAAEKNYRRGFDAGVKATEHEIADAADVGANEERDAIRNEVEHLKWRATLKAAALPLDPVAAAVYDEILDYLGDAS